VALGLLLMGCMRHAPVIVEEQPGAIACRRGPDCDAKWERALAWVRATSPWKVVETSETLIRTDGPFDSIVPASIIRRFPSVEDAGTELIVLEAGCSPERVSAVLDHVPARGPRWRNVAGEHAKLTECKPPVSDLEASFVRFVGESGRAR